MNEGKNHCSGPNELSFLKRCFCEPGWESSSPSSQPLNCSTPLLKHDECECDPADLKRASWTHKQGLRCESLCRWNTQLGAPYSNPNSWKSNQIKSQLPFYKMDLPSKKRTHLKDRLDELASGYGNFHALNNTNLGSVIEFGCGAYTQLRNIMEVGTTILRCCRHYI